MNKRVKGWWFCRENGMLGFSDNRKPRVGVTHKINGTPVLCRHGLHASGSVLDALKFAYGRTLYRVELSGCLVTGDDKMVATERKYLWKIDSERLLYKFARTCALDVVHLWDAPDVVVKFLKTGDPSLRDAAWAAARAAARDAAGAAARAAARAAAGDAAWAAAWDAMHVKQERRLYRMVMTERNRRSG